MQTMNKIIQQQQPIISQIPQEVDMEILWKLIENLERGIHATNLIKGLILQENPSVQMENNDDDQHQNHYKALLDHHSMVCLDTYATSISMLKSLDCDGVFARKRKLEDDDNHVNVISQGSTDMLGSPKLSNTTVIGSRRECYKRRKNGDSSREEEVSQLTDDGFARRKYGQKLIHNFHHPRHYYRCTHNNEQNCKATKQVQQVSDKPTKYKIIYHFNHTCSSILKTSSSMIDFPGDHPSAFVLSFVGSNQRSNPMLFPTSTFPTKVVVAEQNKQNNSPSISDISPSIPQISTATTAGVSSYLISEQCTEEVSVAENYYSSTATSVHWDEDCTLITADYSDLLPDWWTS